MGGLSLIIHHRWFPGLFLRPDLRESYGDLSGLLGPSPLLVCRPPGPRSPLCSPPSFLPVVEAQKPLCRVFRGLCPTHPQREGQAGHPRLCHLDERLGSQRPVRQPRDPGPEARSPPSWGSVLGQSRHRPGGAPTERQVELEHLLVSTAQPRSHCPLTPCAQAPVP